MMRRVVLFLICAVACATMLRAQVIPLAIGNEWVYRAADTGDTIRVTITGNDQRELSCLKRKQKFPAWHDSQGHIYMMLSGGVMIASTEESKEDIVPMFFLPGNLQPGEVPPSSGRACPGNYMFVGFSNVNTPAGTFENSLIYDDRKVHRLYIKPGIGIVKEERYKQKVGDKEVAGEREIDETILLVGYTVRPAMPQGRGPGNAR